MIHIDFELTIRKRPFFFGWFVSFHDDDGVEALTE